MKLLRLDIRHLPGIERRFAVDFAPDTVNVITGPNGSGKSSLVRAVRALLSINRDDPYIEIHSLWQDKDGELHCERLGQTVRWYRDGRSVQAPRLPADEAVGAYLISSEDLAALGKTDAHIAENLQTLLSGGYDLTAVLTAAPFATPSRPQKLARDVETLQRSIADKEAEYAALQEQFEKLGRLETELKQASQSALLLSAIDDALTLADAHASVTALESALIAEFPGGMDRLRGDEMERLDQARAKLQQKHQAIVLEQEAAAREREEIEAGGSADPAELETIQAQLAECRDALVAIEQQLASSEENLALAREASAQAAQRLGSEQPDQVQQLDQQTLESLERQVDKVLSQREKIRSLSGQLALSRASRNPSGRSQDDLRSARSALQDWLALARLSPLEAGLWGSLSLAAALGSVRVLRAQDLTANPELLLLAALAIGLPLAMLGRFFLRLRDRQQALARFQDAAVESPLGWTEAEVRTRLERIETALETATQHEVSQARAAELREQLNAQRVMLERARDQLRTMAENLGISADPRLETGFLLWCRHLQDWQREQQALREQTLRRQQLQHRLQQQTEEARQLLARHEISETDISSRTLATLVHQLQPRIRQLADLHTRLRGRERRLHDLKADLAEIRQQIDLLFESAGVRNDDVADLRRKIEQYPAWSDMERDRRELIQNIGRLENGLEDQPELLELARKPSRSGLEALRQQHQQRAEQRDALNRRIAEIHTRHAEAIKRRELEGLGAELERLQERLRDELDAHMISAAGEHLITEVRSAYRLEHEPALLATADRWLDRFTRHRYRLLFQDGDFFAVDTRSDRRHPVAELSTGGRAQFMLAVRLAWIEQQEQQGESLPVFMDEVLTTSDADRYRAVVKAVRDLVDHDRQLFYLTAQSDDALAWWEWLGEGLEPHAIDMAEVRRGEVEQLEFRLPDRSDSAPAVAEPEDMSPQAWAEAAGVDPIAPWLDAGHVHVAHLVGGNLTLAHRLMLVGVQRLGELERLLSLPDLSTGANALIAEDEAQDLKARCQATRLWLTDWRRTHPRPVDQFCLQASGLLTDRFLPPLVDLAEEVNGDAQLLLQRLREGAVPRFRSDVINQLSEWLTEQRHLLPEGGESRLTVAELMLKTGLAADALEQLTRSLDMAIPAS